MQHPTFAEILNKYVLFNPIATDKRIGNVLLTSRYYRWLREKQLQDPNAAIYPEEIWAVNLLGDPTVELPISPNPPGGKKDTLYDGI